MSGFGYDCGVLIAKNLQFAYRADRPVLRDVSLALGAGRIVMLLGPNGSGKSTLLRVLLGHLHGQGAIEWEGRALRDWRVRDLARRVAYLPQSPMHEPGQTVVQVLRAGRTPYLAAFGIESPRDAEVVEQTARLLELEDLLDRPMEELSGGQRQRAFIGRALAQEPGALLLDEPGTFLDLRHQIDLGRLLKRLAGERGIGILAASHDLNLAGAFGDELMLLKDGAVAATGAPDDVLTAEILRGVYGVEMERIEREGRRAVVTAVV